jgi:hypothetical protein
LQSNNAWQFDWDSRRLIDLVISASQSSDVQSIWEAAAQYYLAAVAGRAAWFGGANGPVAPAADALRRRLSYPPDQNGPPYPQNDAQQSGLDQNRMSVSVESLGRALAQPNPELQ